MAFNYYKKSDAGQFSFIRIPKALMTEESFDSLSLQSKLLYGMLIDRMGASCKNQWIDEENRVYIVYPIQEIQKDMKVSKHKAIDCLSELENIGLVEKRLRGNGRPTHLYVKNFVSASV
ncbi:replication initiator protein A [Kineothrix sedimenti]|uniref:Replication initiator protein A n=1 Tax=Kineothrix sedimenti TaxID=3123317 RepID=A0ABZ3EWW7_9FIRM